MTSQNGTIPRSVIDFQFTEDVEKDTENLNNLLRGGKMVMVNPYWFNGGHCYVRYDPSKLKFMGFDVSTDEWVSTTNPVEGTFNRQTFFMKGSDLFYHKATKTVFLKCEEDWYHVDFTNEKHFVLNNNLSITLHNLVTDEVKTLSEMRAWEVVDSDYDPFSSKWLGTPELNTDYMGNILGGENFYVPSTPRGGKSQTILDMINANNDNSSDEEVESSGEQQEYAQDPNYMDSDEDGQTEDGQTEDGQTDVCDSDYDPEEDMGSDLEEGEVWEDQGWDDQEWLNEYYDERRQDLDGNWYTRRQFYDYYGSDDAWDNLDPNIYQPRRYDEVDCDWHSKEEFFQHYGSDCIWDKMHPQLVVKRTMIWRTYQWSAILPKHLRNSFIKVMLETY